MRNQKKHLMKLKLMTDYQKAIERAKKVWDDLCITSLPLHIREVAELYGFKIIEKNLTADHPGASGYIDSETQTIFIHQADAAVHKRFTIAHELGHYFLHPEELKSRTDLRTYYRKPIGGEIDDKEKQANCFAANLLVPSHLLRSLLANYNDVQIAKMFAVSQQVIGYRRKNLERYS